MTEFPSTRCPEDILVAFLKDIEDRPDRTAVVDQYCKLHPECEDDIRARGGAEGTLVSTSGTGLEPADSAGRFSHPARGCEGRNGDHL